VAETLGDSRHVGLDWGPDPPTTTWKEVGENSTHCCSDSMRPSPNYRVIFVFRVFRWRKRKRSSVVFNVLLELSMLRRHRTDRLQGVQSWCSMIRCSLCVQHCLRVDSAHRRTSNTSGHSLTSTDKQWRRLLVVHSLATTADNTSTHTYMDIPPCEDPVFMTWARTHFHDRRIRILTRTFIK